MSKNEGHKESDRKVCLSLHDIWASEGEESLENRLSVSLCDGVGSFKPLCYRENEIKRPV